MKLAGFLLLLSGGVITLTAIVILPASSSRGIFATAGLAIELVGMVLVFRSHAPAKEGRG